MLSFSELFGLAEDPANLAELPTMFGRTQVYDAEDDEGAPVILICVEPVKGTLVMAILAHKDEESLDELMSYVDENLKID